MNKKHLKEKIFITLQVLIFYVLPLFAGPTDTMGLIVLILLFTLIVSFAIGVLLKSKLKYLYPPLIVLIFVPTIPIYYNSSALVHSIWYFITSIIGTSFGSIIRYCITKLQIK